MSSIVLFFAPLLLAYFVSRTRLLLKGSEDEINGVLDVDLSLWHRFLSGLRSWLEPLQLAG
jgi:hypothetical protein